MFFRLRTRLLFTSLITLGLLIALVLVMIVMLSGLGPAITSVNVLASSAAKANTLTLSSQYASTRLSNAIAGQVSEQTRRDFDQLMDSVDTALTDIDAELGAADQSPDARQLISDLQLNASGYRQTASTLFTAVETQVRNPSPENRAARSQALTAASNADRMFSSQVQQLSTAIQGDVEAARSKLEQLAEQLIATLIGMSLVLVLAITAIQLNTAQSIGGPMSALSAAVGRMREGDLSARIPEGRRDELGLLAQGFNSMAETVQQGRQELEQQNEQLEAAFDARTAALRETVAQLEAAMSAQAAMKALLEGVSTPVLPVASGVLLMPLIGNLDDQRATQAVQLLLSQVERQGAHLVIFDVTGLPVIDTTVAGALIKAARAARLLGADVILAGINPEVAQTLTTLGVELGDIRPVSSLESAISLAFSGAR